MVRVTPDLIIDARGIAALGWDHGRLVIHMNDGVDHQIYSRERAKHDLRTIEQTLLKAMRGRAV